MQSNAKTMNILYCALDPNEFNRISTCESTKEIWDRQSKKSTFLWITMNYLE